MNTIEENRQPVSEKLNPWLSIWVRPKETTRYAIEKMPMGFIMVLVAINGIFDVLDRAVAKNLGDKIATPLIFLIALFAGPLFGLLSWWIGSGIAYIFGKWLGGTGSFKDLRIAYGIVNIIYIIGAVVWIPDLLFIGSSLFTDYVDGGIGTVIWLFISSFLTFIIMVWGFIALLFGVAEAHRFPVWKALLTIILPTIILVLFLAFFVFLLVLIF
ncbi:Yip1 family protein [Sporosarcina sp. Te-1]|uniref:Yip1 family protein n=1 Tax=Sporosarcina sp. Te-1 TaxID=2818390 RepID=UPI001A9DF969|nr:Yip1 family protein [Sporosarcina sp. Te-1]QTD41933.1 YIP1 family protein [Sporosarcina sp. Te-1]